MQAAEKIKQALRPLGAVYHSYSKKKPPTYFTYQLVAGVPVGFADDDNTAMETVWRVDLYSKDDYTELLQKTITALKAVDFYGVTVEAEQFEPDTEYHHISMQINYLEE